MAKDAGVKGDYEKASESFKGFDLAEYGAEGAPNLEGFLFPATYELPKKATVEDLVSRQLDAFEANLAGVDLSYAKSKNLNVYDVLKIASMIEREVQVPEERPLVAAVIYNRLAAGNPLGIDATIRYEDQNYDEQLTESRLADGHALQHPHPPGPAADADRQPRPRLDRGGGEPGQVRRLLLRRQARHLRRARLRRDRGGVRRRPRPNTSGAAGRGRLADRLLSAG